MSNDCYSEWGALRAGVPQGTKLGPWLFFIMFNNVKIPNFELWKYVDDSTMSEVVMKNDRVKLHASTCRSVRDANKNGRFRVE